MSRFQLFLLSVLMKLRAGSCQAHVSDNNAVAHAAVAES